MKDNAAVLYQQEVPQMPNTLSISRRSFARIVVAGAACAVARPIISVAAPSVSYLSSTFTARAPEMAEFVRHNSDDIPYRLSSTPMIAMQHTFLPYLHIQIG